MEQVKEMNVSFVTSGDMFVWLGTICHLVSQWVLTDYVNLLMIILICGFVAIIIVLYMQVSLPSTLYTFMINAMYITDCSSTVFSFHFNHSRNRDFKNPF